MAGLLARVPGWVAPGSGWRREHRPGTPAHGDVAVADGLVSDGELEQAVEDESTGAGPAADEAEDELVDVAR